MTGLDRHGADFEDGIAVYQLKVRKAIPGWLWDWLSGIQGTGKGKGKAGVLVLKTPHQRDEDALVVLSWKSWVELHGTPKSDGRDFTNGNEPYMNCMDCYAKVPLGRSCPSCGI